MRSFYFFITIHSCFFRWLLENPSLKLHICFSCWVEIMLTMDLNFNLSVCIFLLLINDSIREFIWTSPWWILRFIPLLMCSICMEIEYSLCCTKHRKCNKLFWRKCICVLSRLCDKTNSLKHHIGALVSCESIFQNFRDQTINWILLKTITGRWIHNKN